MEVVSAWHRRLLDGKAQAAPSLKESTFQEIPSTNTKAFTASWLFYEAQVSGKKPTWNRIAYRGDAHLNDPVPGGWYDAGDFLKLNMPMAHTVAYLAWAALEFPAAFEKTGDWRVALDNVEWGARYLMACHVSRYAYIGMIGAPDTDHSYWGRPEEAEVERPAYTWTKDTPASDLLGAVSAALTSTSILFRDENATFSEELLDHAKQLYIWGKIYTGCYSEAFPEIASIYTSSRYLDKLMLAAAWLYRATGVMTYALNAAIYWDTLHYVDINTGWDSTYAPAVNILLKMASQGATVPNSEAYDAWFTGRYQSAWLVANGECSLWGGWNIIRTPLGLTYPNWSQWGNLRYASNVAFQMVLRASYAVRDRDRNLEWARGQLDYVLNSTGRSFVVGIGVDPPLQPHHRSASCPDRPTACTREQARVDAANPQVLVGAVVGGPPKGDGSYEDARNNYVCNEVALDYNAGYTGALAGLIGMG